MTAEDHIVAWIESSESHYRRLLEIAAAHNPSYDFNYCAKDCEALATRAYREMYYSGDARQDDTYSPVDILRAAIILAEWKAPE